MNWDWVRNWSDPKLENHPEVWKEGAEENQENFSSNYLFFQRIFEPELPVYEVGIRSTPLRPLTEDNININLTEIEYKDVD
jgi:hypothetical protein